MLLSATQAEFRQLLVGPDIPTLVSKAKLIGFQVSQDQKIRSSRVERNYSLSA